MAKEKIENTNESKPEPKTKEKRAPARPKVDPKAGTQEAKDLKALVAAMTKQNSPETSKDITAHAKETLKLVAQSQKSDSAAFKREAAKALVEFRNFVEQTTKINETRRAQLLSQIDNVTLDAKNAVMMMLSVAKFQADNIRSVAHREAAAQKLAIKEAETLRLAEAEEKAKSIKEEARLKSKALSDEMEAKFKALAEERSVRYKALLEDLKEKQDKQKERKEKQKQQIADARAKLEEQRGKLKQKQAEQKIELEKARETFATEKSKHRNHVKNLREQLKQNQATKRKALEEERDQMRAKNVQKMIEIKAMRTEGAEKIKKLKSDLREDHKLKMQKGKEDLAKRRADMLQKNKDRIQKIREMGVEHKARLKKIEDEHKQEALLRKHNFKKKMAEEERAEAEKSKNRAELGNKVKSGIYEANPLLHAAIEIGVGMGLHDMAKSYLKKRKDKKEAAKLNKLNHTAQGSPKPAAAAGGGAPPSASGSVAPSASNGSSGGMFSGILSMLPSVTSILSGIGTVFTSIVSGFSKVGGFLLQGAKFLPAIAGVATVVKGVFDFIEGFNDASSLFGETIADSDYMRRIYSGFTNVVGSIVGLFDTVAGWLGFDTDLEAGFRKGAVKVFNAIINTFKSLAGGLADLLSYIPGMGGVSKSLKSYSESATPGDSLYAPETPSPGKALTAKTSTVNDLKGELEVKKTRAASVQVVADNSVRQSSTTIVQPKMDTRNKDVPNYYVR